MSSSIQATVAAYRRSAKTMPLPNNAPYLVGANHGYVYGTRGTAARMRTLCLLAHMPHDAGEHLTSVLMNIEGTFRSSNTCSERSRFSDTEFFYVREARAHELQTIAEVWEGLVAKGRPAARSNWGARARHHDCTNWSDPFDFMIKHPEGAVLLFEHYPKLKVLGIPMTTIFGEVVMVTMFRRRDAASLIRWVDVSFETVDVFLDTPCGPITLPKREDIDPRYLGGGRHGGDLSS